MDEYQKQLFEEDRNQSKSQARIVVGANTALLTLSAVVWRFMPGGIVKESFWALLGCWLAAFASVLLLVWSHGLSKKAIAKQLENDSDDIGEAPNRHGDYAIFAWRACVLLFIVAICSFVWFAVLNSDRFSGDARREAPTKASTKSLSETSASTDASGACSASSARSPEQLEASAPSKA